MVYNVSLPAVCSNSTISNRIMLVFAAIIIAVLSSATTIYGAENPYVSCQISGDPRLVPFVLNKNTSMVSSSCALRNAPLTFFRNRYIKIAVVNNGGSMGNIVSFIVSLLDESDSDDDVCTFTEQHFKSSARQFTCGPATIIINGYMQIQNQEADFIVTINNGSYHYSITVQTSWENANSSRGMCRDGCISSYTTNVRSSLVRPTPRDQVTSSLAQQICDVYLKEYTKPNAPVPTSLIEYVKKTHQGCITDVTTMGGKEYAEQALISVISTIMTFDATSLEQIRTRTQEALLLANQLSKTADQVTAQLIANHRA